MNRETQKALGGFLVGVGVALVIGGYAVALVNLHGKDKVAGLLLGGALVCAIGAFIRSDP